MIDVYSYRTPNGQKVHIALEEFELPYRVHQIHIGRGEQFEEEFLRISPNNKIPAIIDHDGPGGGDFALAESGAILLYLAEKTGRLMPQDRREWYRVMQWLMTQMAHFGPMLGQYGHFFRYASEEVPYAKERYGKEADRLYRVLETQLTGHEFLVGDSYTIADIAMFPWVQDVEAFGQTPDDIPNVIRWRDMLLARPQVQRGLETLKDAPAKEKAAP